MTGQLVNRTARRVNAEILVVIGWGRAILLQLAHPLVAAGVSEHSDFREGSLDYLRRSHHTIAAMLSLTFGSPDVVTAQADAINQIHQRVHGRLRVPTSRFPAWTPYSATDPELLRWVHATLVESQLLTYELLVDKLPDSDRDRYCAEAATIGPLLGIPEGLLPETMSSLTGYLEASLASDVIEVTQSARALARALLHPTGLLVGPLFGIGRLATLGLLPPALRQAYGFPWGLSQERRFSRLVGVLRTVRKVLPTRLSQWPVARPGQV